MAFSILIKEVCAANCESQRELTTSGDFCREFHKFDNSDGTPSVTSNSPVVVRNHLPFYDAANIIILVL